MSTNNFWISEQTTAELQAREFPYEISCLESYISDWGTKLCRQQPVLS